MKIILVIDDEVTIRELLEIFLTKIGYQVHVAKDGNEGLRLLEGDCRYDAIITDIEMPEIDGNCIAKHIRASHIEHTPIIAITGMPDARCESQFFDLIVKKPFNLKELRSAIELVVN
jgi:DNA-binding response OmpR family regulator